MPKCHDCKNDAEFSVCSIASTLGETPRRQKSSVSVRLCLRCIRRMSEDPPRIPRKLFDRVSEALQALTLKSNQHLKPLCAHRDSPKQESSPCR